MTAFYMLGGPKDGQVYDIDPEKANEVRFYAAPSFMQLLPIARDAHVYQRIGMEFNGLPVQAYAGLTRTNYKRLQPYICRSAMHLLDKEFAGFAANLLLENSNLLTSRVYEKLHRAGVDMRTVRIETSITSLQGYEANQRVEVSGSGYVIPSYETREEPANAIYGIYGIYDEFEHWLRPRAITEKTEEIMTIPAEAIEAAAKALFNFVHCQESGEVLDWQTEVGEGYRDDYRRHVKPILEAAVPAIRGQIAQEILADADRVARTVPDGYGKAVAIQSRKAMATLITPRRKKKQ